MVDLNELYSIFQKIVQELVNQTRTNTYNGGIEVAEYAPEYLYEYAKHFKVKLFQDDYIYVTLLKDGKPICYINDENRAVYVLTAAFHYCITEMAEVKS